MCMNYCPMNKKMRIEVKRLFMRILQASLPVLAGTTCLLSCHTDAYRCQAIEIKGGYGYLITDPSSDTIIYQPFIPSAPGQMAFRTASDALKAGKAVCNKLENGHPPALTRNELEALGIQLH